MHGFSLASGCFRRRSGKDYNQSLQKSRTVPPDIVPSLVCLFNISYDIKTKFDTSDYPPNHPSGILTVVNKKVIGMFKDEEAGKQITYFVGLRPKLYCFKVEEIKEVRNCKGIKKNVVKKGIDFEDYVQCLFSGEKQMRSMKIIKSENHDIYSKEVNKIALSHEDDKRQVLKDKVKTLALR